MVRDPRGFYGQYPSSLNVSDVGPPSKIPTDGPNHAGDLIELREGPANLRETRLTCHVITGPSQPPPGWYPDPSGIPRQAYWDGQQWLNAGTPSSPRKTNWKAVALVGGGIVALVVIFTILGNLSDATGIGQEVRDGKFAFTVTDASSENVSGLPSARGQWVVVKMNVKNTGTEPQSFFVQNQKLIDSSVATSPPMQWPRWRSTETRW
jgi:hypothetical protein